MKSDQIWSTKLERLTSNMLELKARKTNSKPIWPAYNKLEWTLSFKKKIGHILHTVYGDKSKKKLANQLRSNTKLNTA